MGVVKNNDRQKIDTPPIMALGPSIGILRRPAARNRGVYGADRRGGGDGPAATWLGRRAKRAGDPTGRAAMRMDELIRRYRGEVNRLTAACDREMAFMAAMDEVLDQLPGDQRRVVELRYKQGARWEYIALKMCFSAQHVKRLESLAIEAIGEI